MNTDTSNQPAKTVVPPAISQNDPKPTSHSTNSQQTIIDLASTLQSVDTKSPEAKLNATSIVDAEGKRIELNQDKANSNDFEKVIKKP